MSEMITALRKGYDIWKRAWLTQTIALMVLWFIGFFIIAPLGFLIAINAEAGIPITMDPSRTIAASMLQAVSANPGFWLSIFATVFVVVIINTIIMGTVQKIAHNYAETGSGRFGEAVRELVPTIIPLVVVTMLSAILVGIPSLMGAEVLHRMRDPTLPTILSFTPLEFVGRVHLTSVDVIGLLFMTLVFILLGGPYLLAVPAVVVDKAGIDGIAEGWNLYFRRLLSTIVAMVILLVIGLVITRVFFIPIEGIVGAVGLSEILLNVFVLLVLIPIVGVFANWLFTSLYVFYRELKE